MLVDSPDSRADHFKTPLSDFPPRFCRTRVFSRREVPSGHNGTRTSTTFPCSSDSGGRSLREFFAGVDYNLCVIVDPAFSTRTISCHPGPQPGGLVCKGLGRELLAEQLERRSRSCWWSKCRSMVHQIATK